MTSNEITLPKTDADLVAASLSGSRDAFGEIVSRYQSLICAVAYSATGDLGQSEDVAQETFLAAWQHLAELRDPAQLRAWLRGIARNLTHRSLRSRRREPIDQADSLEEINEPPATEPLPAERAISNDEAGILWRSLERIPENYREPLVLFYREHQSVETVARSLDLSEESVRQRLTRGRKLLHREVLALVETALEKTTPGPAFTQAVIAGLPTAMAAAKAGSAGVVAAKGGAGMKGLITLSAWAAWLGFLGAMMFQWKNAVDETKSRRERKFIIQMAAFQILSFVILIAAVIFIIPHFYQRPVFFSITLIFLILVNLVISVIMSVYLPQRATEIRLEENTWADIGLDGSERDWNRKAFRKALKFSAPFLLMFAGSGIGLPWKHHWVRCAAVVAAELAVVVWGYRRQYNLFRFKQLPQIKPATGLRNPLVRIPAVLLGAMLAGTAISIILPPFLYGTPFPTIHLAWFRNVGLSFLLAVVAYAVFALLLTRTGLIKSFAPILGQSLGALLQASRSPAAVIDKTYGPLFKRLNLASDVRAQLKNLILQKTMAGVKTGLSLMNRGLNNEKRADIVNGVTRDTEDCNARIQQLLGDGDYQTFKEYESSVPDRTMVGSLKGKLGALSPEQQEEVIEALAQARAQFQWSTVLSRRRQNFAEHIEQMTAENLAAFEREEEAFDRQFLERARELLSSPQVAALEKAQQQRRQLMISQYRIGAKLFGR